jgi:type II secretory pathway component PulF
MEDKQPEQDHDPALKDRWENVLKVRQKFSAELDSMATDLPGVGRQQLRSLSRWFQGSAKFEDAILRPDVLAFCLPLVNSAEQGSITSSGMAQAARRGFCSVGRYQTVNRHLFRILLYPTLILFAACLLWIGFSFWIAPQFQEMFEEFGIELPRITRLVLWLAHAVRQWCWAILVFPVGVCLCWILNRVGRDRRPANQTWLDQRWMSTRNAVASWAWHISLLLEAGLTQSAATRIAGTAAANSRLRRISFEVTGSRQLDALGQEQPFLFDPKFQLLDYAMRMPESPGKIALLREVATYYWDRNRNVGDWWVQWLVAVMLWCILAAIVITVLSLFFPLVAIVSGLTSTK